MSYQSKYFSDDELSCKCCGQLHATDTLKKGLDRIREAIGRPLYVSCAYRCPSHNEEVGGVPNSQHTKGTAADCLLPDGMSFGEFKWYVDTYSKADGIGYYESDEFIHIDFRSNGTEPGEYIWEG